MLGNSDETPLVEAERLKKKTGELFTFLAEKVADSHVSGRNLDERLEGAVFNDATSDIGCTPSLRQLIEVQPFSFR